MKHLNSMKMHSTDLEQLDTKVNVYTKPETEVWDGNDMDRCTEDVTTAINNIDSPAADDIHSVEMQDTHSHVSVQHDILQTVDSSELERIGDNTVLDNDLDVSGVSKREESASSGNGGKPCFSYSREALLDCGNIFSPREERPSKALPVLQLSQRCSLRSDVESIQEEAAKIPYKGQRSSLATFTRSLNEALPPISPSPLQQLLDETLAAAIEGTGPKDNRMDASSGSFRKEEEVIAKRIRSFLEPMRKASKKKFVEGQAAPAVSPNAQLLRNVQEELVLLVKTSKNRQIKLENVISEYCKACNNFLNPCKFGFSDMKGLIESVFPSLYIETVPTDNLAPHPQAHSSFVVNYLRPLKSPEEMFLINLLFHTIAQWSHDDTMDGSMGEAPQFGGIPIAKLPSAMKQRYGYQYDLHTLLSICKIHNFRRFLDSLPGLDILKLPQNTKVRISKGFHIPRMDCAAFMFTHLGAVRLPYKSGPTPPFERSNTPQRLNPVPPHQQNPTIPGESQQDAVQGYKPASRNADAAFDAITAKSDPSLEAATVNIPTRDATTLSTLQPEGDSYSKHTLMTLPVQLLPTFMKPATRTPTARSSKAPLRSVSKANSSFSEKTQTLVSKPFWGTPAIDKASPEEVAAVLELKLAAEIADETISAESTQPKLLLEASTVEGTSLPSNTALESSQNPAPDVTPPQLGATAPLLASEATPYNKNVELKVKQRPSNALSVHFDNTLVGGSKEQVIESSKKGNVAPPPSVDNTALPSSPHTATWSSTVAVASIRFQLRRMLFELIAVGCERQKQRWFRGEDLVELEEDELLGFNIEANGEESGKEESKALFDSGEEEENDGEDDFSESSNNENMNTLDRLERRIRKKREKKEKRRRKRAKLRILEWSVGTGASKTGIQRPQQIAAVPCNTVAELSVCGGEKVAVQDTPVADYGTHTVEPQAYPATKSVNEEGAPLSLKSDDRASVSMARPLSLLASLTATEIEERRQFYRLRAVGLLVSTIKAEWIRRFGEQCPLSAYMNYFGIRKMKFLLQEVPNLIIHGCGGFMRVATLEHTKEVWDQLHPEWQNSEVWSRIPCLGTQISSIPMFKASHYAHLVSSTDFIPSVSPYVPLAPSYADSEVKKNAPNLEASRNTSIHRREVASSIPAVPNASSVAPIVSPPVDVATPNTPRHIVSPEHSSTWRPSLLLMKNAPPVPNAPLPHTKHPSISNGKDLKPHLCRLMFNLISEVYENQITVQLSERNRRDTFTPQADKSMWRSHNGVYEDAAGAMGLRLADIPYEWYKLYGDHILPLVKEAGLKDIEELVKAVKHVLVVGHGEEKRCIIVLPNPEVKSEFKPENAVNSVNPSSSNHLSSEEPKRHPGNAGLTNAAKTEPMLPVAASSAAFSGQSSQDYANSIANAMAVIQRASSAQIAAINTLVSACTQQNPSSPSGVPFFTSIAPNNKQATDSLHNGAAQPQAGTDAINTLLTLLLSKLNISDASLPNSRNETAPCNTRDRHPVSNISSEFHDVHHPDYKKHAYGNKYKLPQAYPSVMGPAADFLSTFLVPQNVLDAAAVADYTSTKAPFSNENNSFSEGTYTGNRAYQNLRNPKSDSNTRYINFPHREKMKSKLSGVSPKETMYFPHYNPGKFWASKKAAAAMAYNGSQNPRHSMFMNINSAVVKESLKHSYTGKSYGSNMYTDGKQRFIK